MRVISKSPSQTKEIGIELGEKLKAGDIVLLFGELGSGKTTFVKGIAEALGVPEGDISSASFLIIAEHQGRLPLYHIDLYRVEGEEAIEDAGIYECLGGDAVAVVEWAEKMPEIKNAIKVRINTIDKKTREILID